MSTVCPSVARHRRAHRAAVAAVLLCAFLLHFVATPPAAAQERLRETEVVFTGSGGTRLHGSVIAPAAGDRLRPAVVVVHGSGPGRRDDYRAEADALARRGVAVLIYDKRTEGYSVLRRDYGVLAGDALAAVRTLRAFPGVDPHRTGLLGISEGGAVAPLAANRSPDPAFVVTVGAVAVSPARQQAWSYGNFLRHAGVTGSLLTTMESRVVPQLVSAGLFPEARHNPISALRELRQPVLALWGGFDRFAPPREGAETFRTVLGYGATSRYRVVVLPAAEHGLHRTTDAGYTRTATLAPGYPDLVASWISGRPGAVPGTTTEPPDQERRTAPVATPASYETPWVQLTVVLLLLAAFGGYLVLGLADRAAARVRRRRSGEEPERRTPGPSAARWTALAGTVSVLGGLGWLAWLVLTAAQAIGPVVAGRPLPWLLVQVASATTVAAATVTAVSWWRAPAGGHWPGSGTGRRFRFLMLLGGGALFVPWSVHWGLLVP
ncbi:alpha/beta hydrolase [Streptomyces sp. NPDC048312]|uniref:alpha/beta hydrolase family protein n=1 Tax=Streptomyces sp. NPDC048312 TaxID=3155485 RepID=UPI00340D18BC